MKLLSALFEVTAYSAVLFAAVMGFKLAFKSRLSPALHFALWFLVIARLCIPVTVESDFHFFAASKPGGEAELQVPVPEAPEERTTAFTGGEAFSDTPSVEAPAPAPAAAAIPAAVPKRKPVSSWADALTALWIAGMAFRAARLLFSERSMRRAVAHNTLPTDARMRDIYDACCAELGIAHKLPLQSMAGIYSPALTVSLKPMILLPANITDTLSEAQLAYALRHEFMHYRRRDHLLALLLLLLTCVYWFNPVVWLMKRELMKDMETACDSAVTARLNGAERREYAMTLLALFSQPYRVNSVLGMALSSAEKDAERRVRGVFGAHRSKAPVKILAALLSALLLACCFTTACQPTPEASVIIVGDDSKYLEPASQGGNPLTDDLPERYEGIIDVENKNVKIKIDASVISPVLERYAVFSARPEFISQAMVDKARAALIGDKTMYDPLSVTDLTQEEVLIRLSSYKQAQAELQGRNESSPYIDDMIAFYEEKLKIAPMTIDRTVNDGKFGDKRSVAEQKSDSPPVPTLLPPGNDYNRITASVDLGNETLATFSAYRSDSGKLSYIRLENTGTAYLAKQYRVNRADIEELSTTFSKAKSMAQEVIKNIGLDYMEAFAELSVTAVNPVEGRNSHDCYLFIFTRGFNGLPAMYHKPMLARGEASAAYAEPWADEYAAVTIDDAGIVYFTWESPTTVKTVNESVALLSFDRIMEFLAQHCRSSLSWIDESIKSISIEITEIRLCMAKISTGADEYLYVPAWDFIGISQSDMADGTTATENGAEQSYFTINAIDGSIIDRNLGY